MRYLPSLVTVRDIQPRTSRAEHPPETVEQLAREILAAGGLARPLVVRQTGMESFALLDGELAYHAAARARELDPVQAEAVLAFIATRNNEAELLKQLDLLASTSPQRAQQAAVATDARGLLAGVEHLLNQQLRHFEAYQREGKLAWQEAKDELVARIPQPPKMLRLLNGEDDATLQGLLKATGQRADPIMAAIRAERRQSRFVSAHEAAKRTPGLSFERVVKMADRCEGTVSLSATADGPAREVAAV